MDEVENSAAPAFPRAARQVSSGMEENGPVLPESGQDQTTIGEAKLKPRPLEEAVDKATEIDDPIDNVAQGMQNIGQAWATAPNPYLIPMNGTTGQTMMILGVGSSIEGTDEVGKSAAGA
ncbi:hypothetical protein PR003_g21155 [Phytophthora rubi]|uniref:Uncharacterized protein n=1 Tax=Phytophthora rubi TaxID=129364 RepID=A0A6A3JWC7_9STRA|nr:hypothetical protein PR001_g19548 [Phytophthora rubi]KAE9306809.1 hypothetical protein PR003_g21155 [Phytophthora rubi]